MAKDMEDESMLADEDIIVLQDEDGKEIEFVQIATLDYKDEWYAFLQPTELGDMAEDEMLLFKLESDENGDDYFVPVEDKEITEALYNEYLKEYALENPDEEFCDGACSMCGKADCADRDN